MVTGGAAEAISVPHFHPRHAVLHPQLRPLTELRDTNCRSCLVLRSDTSQCSSLLILSILGFQFAKPSSFFVLCLSPAPALFLEFCSFFWPGFCIFFGRWKSSSGFYWRWSSTSIGSRTISSSFTDSRSSPHFSCFLAFILFVTDFWKLFTLLLSRFCFLYRFLPSVAQDISLPLWLPL